jgi:hypothetical protein
MMIHRDMTGRTHAPALRTDDFNVDQLYRLSGGSVGIGGREYRKPIWVRRDAST